MKAVFFNRYKGRKFLFFISKCSGDILFKKKKKKKYRIWRSAQFSVQECNLTYFYKKVVMSLDFAEIKNIENMFMGMT